MNHFVEILTLKLIFKIMKQKQILKMFHMLIHVACFTLKTNLANLKIEVDKLDIDKLEPVPVLLRKQIMTQKLLKLKRNLLIIIMINILQLQSLIL